MRCGCVTMAVLLGCGPAVAVDGEDSTGDGGTGTSTTLGTTTGATSSTTTVPGTTTVMTTSVDVTTSEDESSEVSGFFLGDPDGGGSCVTHCTYCDLWNQDCGEGDRCVPWAGDGGDQWNRARCIELAPEPVQPGGPCTVFDFPQSGNDDCAISSLCWDVDPETGLGTCVEYCGGSEANPSCPEGTSCFIANDGVLILCLPTCDPLAPMCGDGEACAANDDEFFCVPTERVVEAYNDPCEPNLGCGSGLHCAGPGSTPKCDASCCTALCDLAAPSCPDADGGQVCVPYYEPGTAPLGFENLGICLVE